MAGDPGAAVHPCRRGRGPQRGRQALLHSVGIDDAAASLVGDRLVVAKYPYGWSWASASFHVLPQVPGRVWGALPERGDVVIVVQPTTGEDLIKRVIGLPGDTIAGDRRHRLSQRPADPAPAAPPGDDPDRRQYEMRLPRVRRVPGDRRGRQALLPPAHLPRDPAQRPFLRHDRSRPFGRRRLSADHRPAGPRLPDGRQSRRQRRQPLPARRSGGLAGRCPWKISAAAPSSSPSASTAAPPTGTRSAGSPPCAAAVRAPRCMRSVPRHSAEALRDEPASPLPFRGGGRGWGMCRPDMASGRGRPEPAHGGGCFAHRVRDKPHPNPSPEGEGL